MQRFIHTDFAVFRSDDGQTEFAQDDFEQFTIFVGIIDDQNCSRWKLPLDGSMRNTFVAESDRTVRLDERDLVERTSSNCHGENASFSNFALDFNVTAQCLRKLLADRQAEPRTAVAPRYRCISLYERIEDRLQFFCRNTNTRIDHCNR